MAATSKDQFLGRISNDEFELIVRQAYREGIKIGKQLAKSEDKPAISSRAFNPSRLFQSGKHPHLSKEVDSLIDDRNLCRDEWVFHNGYHPEYDFRNFYDRDIQNAIRKLVLATFNASKNGDIPREHRKEALSFYDSLADQWLQFANKHLPTYGKEGKLNEPQLSSKTSFQDD